MRVQESIVEEEVRESRFILMGVVPLDKFSGADANLAADESPINTKSKIKFIRKKFMHGDEIESLSGFEEESDDNPQSEHKEKFSKANEEVVDNNFESSLSQKIADKIEKLVPRIVANALEERIPKMLSNTLKTILPDSLNDFDKNDVNLRELVDLIKDIVILIDTILASAKAAPEGENLSTQIKKRYKDYSLYSSSGGATANAHN
ncbi:hypothetical protein Tco_1038482 [Tanacetum coccineum]